MAVHVAGSKCREGVPLVSASPQERPKRSGGSRGVGLQSEPLGVGVG